MSELMNAVILAAGKGTRLKIATPKPLCVCLGRTLVDYVIQNIVDFSKASKLSLNLGVVVGHEKEKVSDSIKSSYSDLKLSFADQDKQLGTGHALKCYFDTYPNAWESKYTLIVCADTPLITDDVYSRLQEELEKKSLDAVVATFKVANPKGYGRILKSTSGAGLTIREEKDASDEERLITEVNSAVYLMKTSYIKEHINNLDNKNKSGEFYLTDLMKEGEKLDSVLFDDADSFLGVNDLVQLDEARGILQTRINQTHMRNGVQIINSNSVYIEPDVKIGSNTVIYPHSHLEGNTVLGESVTIETGSVIKNSEISNEVTVKANSYFEKAIIKNSSVIGPMARLREGTVIGERCKIGNCVETKKVNVADEVKVSHLSYLGDAEVGQGTNIGCGFVTCNYDGAKKHLTKIGENSFIGSDCQVIAPITIGSETYIGSGSTINQNVPDGAFAIARQRQVTKEKMASRFLKTSK